MDKMYYNAESLDRAVREFESEYGLASEELHARYIAGESIEGVPRFEQHLWASFYEDVLRLTDGAGVERTEIMERVGRALTCVA
ncbi:MAG: hypothetical protein H0X28_06025 [Solirubrobacterales bacterium]|nr:hypothetical protein [Solirubrobacterales bacterium]